MSASATIGTIVLVVATTEINAIKRGSLSLRPVIGGFILGIFLFPLDSFNADLSKKVQILIVLTALLVNGPALFTFLGKAPLAARKELKI